MVDTGLDMRHCNFFDPSYPSMEPFLASDYFLTNYFNVTVAYGDQVDGYMPVYRNKAHRKVAAYFGYGGKSRSSHTSQSLTIMAWLHGSTIVAGQGAL